MIWRDTRCKPSRSARERGTKAGRVPKSPGADSADALQVSPGAILNDLE